MKVARVTPPVEPVFSLTFRRDEGLALVMALRDAYHKYPKAAQRDQWCAWADDLAKELGRA